jgi:radical SAM-linked protein
LRTAPGGETITNEHRFVAADAILPLVQRPSRYINGELNLSNAGFREGRFNVLLVFPDVYEIGMSHQGIRFLYHGLAAVEGVGVELAFAPWPDAERLMRATGEPLRSLQTNTAASRFDFIGFSLTYELHYTNVLMVLELCGLAYEASRRREADPLVVGGGPCCTNPMPFLEALDAIFLGDGEDSLPEAVRALASRKAAGNGAVPRSAGREVLAAIEGIYVDGLTSAAAARTHRFADGELPRRPLVASSELIHQRLAIEIMRGCARGCRFCHAGMFYRPCRERSVEEIVGAALEGLEWTGWDEVSLLSLSTSDYSRIDELLARLVPELERRRVSLALPSLRPETITESIVAASSTVTKSGFTLAPEAGTERLRRVIRKDFTDADIMRGVRRIFAGGWQTLKLYFMIGLPTETDEDLDGIARLIREVTVLPRGRDRFKLSVSISPFVPKPHTPFQWERQCSVEDFRNKEAFLAARIRGRHVDLNQRDPSVSVLEGILSRGDRRLWPVVRRAYELGCRFDGWTDQLRFDLWERALAESGLTIPELIAARPLDEPLPWDVFELHTTGGLLRRERDRAYAESAGGPRSGEDVGSSGGEGSATGAGGTAPARRDRPPTGPRIERPVYRYRFMYEKRGRERFLSHIEMMNVIQRALRRSGLPLNFTEGFHPHPRISAGPSLAVGVEGLGEFFDAELMEKAHPSPEHVNPFLPAGIRIKACSGPFTRREGKLPRESRFRYLLDFGVLGTLLECAGAPSEILSQSERMWYLLGKELGVSDQPRLFEGGAPVDPASRLHADWKRLFDAGASVRDEKGRERSCAGSSVRVAEAREGAGPEETAREIGDAAGPTVAKALELEIPGTEGAVRPQDLVSVFLPKNLASLVRICRLEMLYICEDGLIDPMTMVEAKRLGR